MKAQLVSLTTVVVLSLAGCGSDGRPSTQQLNSQGVYQDFFWQYCLSLAEVFTELSAQANTRRVASAPIDCPDGGTATYDSDANLVVLSDCAGFGATVAGTISATLEPQQAMIFGGSLSIEGVFEGTATINSGLMQWELPVADATTYWELRLNLDGEEICIWSGAETGPCPSPF